MVSIRPILFPDKTELALEYFSEQPLTLKLDGRELLLPSATGWTKKRLSLDHKELKNIDVTAAHKPLSFPQLFISAPTIIDDKKSRATKTRNTLTIDGALEIDQLKLEPGTVVILTPNSSLKINGSVSWLGTKEKPITFKAKETDKGWAHVLIVQSEDEKSSLAHVHFEFAESDLKAFPMGALNLYGGKFEVSHLRFRDIKKEDALNFVNTTFTGSHIEIQRTGSDAIDVDFSNGKLDHISIHQAGVISGAGGDGLDVSGSQLEVEAISMEQVADKGFSIGEGSKVQINGARVKSSKIAVAVKDGATAVFKDLSIEASGKNFDVYIKKPWFDTPTNLVLKDARYRETKLDLCGNCHLRVEHE